MKYGTYGAVKATRGKVHDYLGMNFDFSEPGMVHIDMIDYINKMVDDSKIDFNKSAVVTSPAADTLFGPSTGEKLNKEQAEEYHYRCGKRFVCMQTCTT